MNTKPAFPYTFRQNMAYYYHNLYEWYPRLFAAGFLLIIPDILLRLGSVGLTRIFAAGLSEEWAPAVYLGTLAAIAAALFVCSILAKALRSYVEACCPMYIYRYEILIGMKKMDMDYEIAESKQFQDRAQKALQNLWGFNGLSHKMEVINHFLSSLGGCLVFGAILSLKNPLILLYLLFSTVVLYAFLCLARQSEERNAESLAEQYRKKHYLFTKSMDISAGKDIRLYNMSGWFLHLLDGAQKAQNRIYAKIWDWYFANNIADGTLKFIRDILIYVYLITEICSGNMSVPDFIFYTGIVSSLSDLLWDLEENLHDLAGASFCIRCIREFLDSPDQEDPASFVPPASAQKTASLSLEHVSYRYPGAKKDTIHDLNLTICAGENLALVGLNGAGKTTLVKLLCRLYHPTQGQILLNGIPIEQFKREDYFSLLSVLFQNSSFLPLTVDENIASCPAEQIDHSRLLESYLSSGISPKIEHLPDGGSTFMNREIHDNAVDFSGGELQKLLLSRAIYRQTPILILDEPTAALDPIAEHQIYVRYTELAKGRTTLFISHRLASTRFCDRIVLLENGQIIEEGTHEALLRQNGRYAELFRIQSNYYQDEKGAVNNDKN
ncbi:MAG: ABC transporter ATP-binding protein [Eisenbergiella sp.]